MGTRTEFAEFIRRRIEESEPGAPLPTDRQLAASAGLSVRTVVAVMQELARSGAVTRVRGKGTFVAGAVDLVEMPVPRGTAVDNLADFIYASMCRGELKRGEALPSVKYLSHQMKVSPATVIAAYRALAKRADITKVGKTYWFGDYHSLVHQQSGKEVYVYLASDADRDRVFRNRTHGAMYHTMEEVLSSSGYLVRYAPLGQFQKDVRRWARGAFPFGVVLSTLNAARLAGVEETLRTIRRSVDRRQMPIVAHWEGGDFTPMLRFGHVVYRLGMTGYRFLARHLIEKGHKSATFFIDASHLLDNDFRFWIMWDFVHLRAEILHLDPSFGWNLAIVDPEGSFSWDQYPFRFRPENVARIASQYAPFTYEEVVSGVAIECDLANAFDRAREHPVWVFQKDTHAASALEWAESSRVRIPEQLSLLSLDNDPDYHHLGLSRCELDWEGIGYLMAHVIIGDFQIPVTEEGVMRVRARVVEKLTTK